MLDWLFGNGIGTNLGASLIWTAVCALVGLLLWPPTRRWITKHVKRMLAPFHEHFRLLHEDREWHANEMAKQSRALGIEPAAHPHFDIRKGSPHDT
jgi:hypothetical protein